MVHKILATIHGKAVFPGDILYSTYHGQSDTVKDSIVDDDGDCYLVFENIGHAHVNSCLPTQPWSKR